MKEIRLFEETLEKLKAAYELDDRAEREAEREKIYADLGKDPNATRVFRFYAEAKERENDFIDIDDWDDKKVPELLEQLRSFGIEQITISSTWSGTVGLAQLVWYGPSSKTDAILKVCVTSTPVTRTGRLASSSRNLRSCSRSKGGKQI